MIATLMPYIGAGYYFLHPQMHWSTTSHLISGVCIGLVGGLIGARLINILLISTIVQILISFMSAG